MTRIEELEREVALLEKIVELRRMIAAQPLPQQPTPSWPVWPTHPIIPDPYRFYYMNTAGVGASKQQGGQMGTLS